jgi:hypothetical protein
LTEATTLALVCISCLRDFRRPQSLVRKGSRSFCSTTCNATFYRKRRAKTAKGTCVDCGGTTTKKSYQRCRACAITSRRFRSPGRKLEVENP